jgi:tRNA1Val (adenine37-N6)-methyltransferase
MKVCTDACIFGAWTAEKLKSQKSKVKNILDIGAGTGVLSLMLAQEVTPDTFIDAVEIDRDAARQATDNFAHSPWKRQMQLHKTPIQQFQPPEGVQYDFIITNPPFFENDLPSNDDKRNLALHSTALTLEELLTAIDPILKQDGKLAILLPYHRTKNFVAAAEKFRLYPETSTSLKQTFLHSNFRSMMLFNRIPPEESVPATRSQAIVIRDAAGNYSEAFDDLLREYYLYL